MAIEKLKKQQAIELEQKARRVLNEIGDYVEVNKNSRLFSHKTRYNSGDLEIELEGGIDDACSGRHNVTVKYKGKTVLVGNEYNVYTVVPEKKWKNELDRAYQQATEVANEREERYRKSCEKENKDD